MNPNSHRVIQPPLRGAIVEEELSYGVVGGFYDTYNELGYGFSEPIYQRALIITLEDRGFKVEREFPIDVHFRGVLIGHHRLDLLVNGRLIIEIKATDRLSDATKRQVRNYLAVSGLELGLILHFGPQAKYYRVLAPRTIHPHQPIRANPSDSDA